MNFRLFVENERIKKIEEALFNCKNKYTKENLEDKYKECKDAIVEAVTKNVLMKQFTLSFDFYYLALYIYFRLKQDGFEKMELHEGWSKIKLVINFG